MRRADADDAFFLAGGVAFNVLLAGIPFILLLTAGLGFILDQSTDAANRVVQATLENLLPSRLTANGSILDPLLVDVVRTRALVGGLFFFLGFSAQVVSFYMSFLRQENKPFF